MSKTLSKLKVVNIIYIEGEEEKTKKVLVKKAGLGKAKRLTSAIGGIFSALPDYLKAKGIEDTDKFIQELEIEDLLGLVPELLQLGVDQLMEIVSIAADLELEFIEEYVGIDEALEILEATFEVNNFDKALEKAKNLMAKAGVKLKTVE